MLVGMRIASFHILLLVCCLGTLAAIGVGIGLFVYSRSRKGQKPAGHDPQL